MKRAVIDIGTNTLLLLIAETDAAGGVRVLADLCRFGRLGSGLDATGRLATESIARSLDICREYRGVLDAHGIAAARVVGTQALREASNASEFVVTAEHLLGSPIEVIEGTREAELAFLSVARTFPDLAGVPYLVVDVGGGSTEIIATDGHRIVSAVSVPIGAVRLTDRHGQPPGCRDGLARDIAAHLDRLALPSGVPIVATAGTATTMASVWLALETFDSERVTGVRLSPSDVASLYTRFMTATVDERRAMPGMEPGRADVIHAGTAILDALVTRTSAPVMITADRGVRWGLLLEAG